MRGRKSGGQGLHALVKQANQMQNKMKKLEDELKLKEYTATAGGDAVEAIIKGDRIERLKISEEVLKEGDPEILQDMIITAVNEALSVAKKEHDEQVQGLSKGFSLPGM